MDMDMDVAWCLTCSKRTRDPRSPYCSEGCRLADHGAALPTPTALITSEIPPLIPASASRKSYSRPPLATLAPHGPNSTSVDLPSPPAPRDRRAFSFPNAAAEPVEAVLLSGRSREGRVTQHALPPFARRSMAYTGPSKAPGLASTPEIFSSPKLKHTAPPDSVFCSTSESSDNEVIDVGSPAKPTIVASLPAVKAVSPVPAPALAAPLTPAESPKRDRDSRYSSLRSQLSTARAGSYLAARKVSPPHGSVAALIASSASSRSREDIISWAKAIELRETDSESEATSPISPRRGRSRTRRKSELAHLSPQIEGPQTADPRSEEYDSGAIATTPKGFTSTLAGLSIVQPFVKAITSSVALSRTSTKNGPRAPPPHPVYRAMPVPAELCKIAVVASTGPAEAEWPAHMLGGATPTLSTISFSELPELSVTTDLPDHNDISADDVSMASVSIARRSGIRRARKAVVSFSETKPEPKPRSNIPGVQVGTNAANAIWQFSSYIRSFAPFSISSVMPPYNAPATAPERPTRDSETPTPSSPTPEHTPGLPSPLPASRKASSIVNDTGDVTFDAAMTEAVELVRSLPMDIVIPPVHSAQAAKAAEERTREREAQDWLDQQQPQFPKTAYPVVEGEGGRGRLGQMTSRSRGSRGRSGSRARKDRDLEMDVESGQQPEKSQRPSSSVSSRDRVRGREERDGSEADREDEDRRGRGRRGRARALEA